MTGSEDGKRKRVSKACDACRSRKLKCDAVLPACFRCAAAGLKCKYTHTSKKRPRKQKKPPAQTSSSDGLTITDLGKRMSRMEGLIHTLVGKLDPTLVPHPETVDEDESSGDDTFHDAEVESNTSNHNDIIDNAIHDNAEKLGVHHRYFGSQSTFSVLSAKGFMWLGKRIGDQSLLPRFQSFHTRVAAIFLWTNRRWIEPIERSELSPLPEKEMTLKLIDHFYEDFCFGAFILKKQDLIDLFNIYYASTDGVVQGRRLTNSDFLTMSVAVTLGSQFMMDGCTDMIESHRALLKDLIAKMTDNMIYYYNRVSVISEGLRTIQALMLFNFYTELSRGPPHNYILVSTMVRYAQEIGLHRRESLVGLSKDEVMYRKRMWLLIYIFDRGCCLMSGKPPIINVDDVSSVAPGEIENVLFHDIDPKIVSKMKDPSFDAISAVEELERKSDDPNAYMKSPLFMLTPYYHLMFVEFTSKVYTKLFSAQSLSGKSLSQVLLIIDELNGQLESLKNSINVKLRPGIEISSIKSLRMRYNIATTHFQYYQLSMIINRMAFTRAWLNHDTTDEFMNTSNLSQATPLQFKLMIKCLEQARAIVSLVHDIGSHHQQLFTRYLSFQFFSAFFTMFTGLLEFPKSQHFKSDIDLLFKVSRGLLDDISKVSSTFNDICTYNVICYSVRFFLRIAILAYNSENNATVIDTKDIDAEIVYYWKVLGDMSAKCNQKLRNNDPLCVNPPKTTNSPANSAALGSFGNSYNNNTTYNGNSAAKGVTSQALSNQSGSPGRVSHLPQQQFHAQHVPVGQQVRSPVFPIHNEGDQLFNSFPMDMSNSGVSTTGQTPDEKSLEFLTLEMFEGERHSNILQQVFALPDFYLNANDTAPFDVDPNMMF